MWPQRVAITLTLSAICFTASAMAAQVPSLEANKPQMKAASHIQIPNISTGHGVQERLILAQRKKRKSGDARNGRRSRPARRSRRRSGRIVGGIAAAIIAGIIANEIARADRRDWGSRCRRWYRQCDFGDARACRRFYRQCY